MSADGQELLEVAVRAARRGGEVLRTLFGEADLGAEEKARNDFVSRADHESEAAVLDEITGAFPGHRVLAEESGEADADSEYTWIVDPLDGTTNYLRGVPYFCVSVACTRAGEAVAGVVLDPLRDDLFTAVRGGGARRGGRPLRLSREEGLAGAVLATGFPFKAHPALDVYLDLFRDAFRSARAIRRCGAAALDLAYTAAGVYDGFFEFRLSPWDLAAGCLLVEQAGGLVSDLDGGGRFLTTGSVVAGAAAVHHELLAVVQEHTSERSLEELLRGS